MLPVDASPSKAFRAGGCGAARLLRPSPWKFLALPQRPHPLGSYIGRREGARGATQAGGKDPESHGGALLPGAPRKRRGLPLLPGASGLRHPSLGALPLRGGKASLHPLPDPLLPPRAPGGDARGDALRRTSHAVAPPVPGDPPPPGPALRPRARKAPGEARHLLSQSPPGADAPHHGDAPGATGGPVAQTFLVFTTNPRSVHPRFASPVHAFRGGNEVKGPRRQP